MSTASPERLSEVRRLTEALMDQVLEAQILGRPVPEEQSTALVKAAFFLRDSNLPWWPMLAQALHDLGHDTNAPASEDAKAEALRDADLEELSRFFAGFRTKGSVVTYTVEQLAPGSYDLLLDGVLVAAMVRVVERKGQNDQWQVDLLEESSPADRPLPFTAQTHTFHSRLAALEWLGIRLPDPEHAK